MKISDNKKTNQFTASMILENIPENNYEESLNRINSYFIGQFVNEKEFSKKIDGEKTKSLQVGFAMTSGKHRAKKAIELALSTLLVNYRLLHKSILLLISVDTIELELDEIGIINDYIQEKSEYNADIVMGVNVDENLCEALAVTIILTEQ